MKNVFFIQKQLMVKILKFYLQIQIYLKCLWMKNLIMLDIIMNIMNYMKMFILILNFIMKEN